MSVYDQNTMNISEIDNWWEADEYCSFLHWMADNKIGDNVDGLEGAHEIIYIVEKPWKYREEWLEFKKETENN